MGPCNWYHHPMNLLDPFILFAPAHISFIGFPAMYSTILPWCLRTYSPIGQSPFTSSAASTKVHYHSTTLTIHSVIPVIHIEILQWKPSTTVIIASTTTQILLTYRSTACTTFLHNIDWSFIGTPVFHITFATILHRMYWIHSGTGCYHRIVS